jgi:hypothetical protein
VLDWLIARNEADRIEAERMKRSSSKNSGTNPDYVGP